MPESLRSFIRVPQGTWMLGVEWCAWTVWVHLVLVTIEIHWSRT